MIRLQLIYNQKKYCIIISAICLLISFQIQGQNADSLKLAIKNSKGIEQLETIEFFSKKFFYKAPKETITYSKLGIQLSKELNRKDITANLYRLRGRSFNVLGERDSTLVALNNAYAIAKELSDSLQLLKVQSTFGGYYRHVGNYPKAREFYTKAIETAQESNVENKHNYIAIAKSGIAKTYYLTSDYKTFLEEIEGVLAYKKLHQINDSDDQINKAIALYQLDRPEEAIDIFMNYKSQYENEGNVSRVNQINHHIGFLLERIGLYEEAQVYYYEVLDFFEDHGDVKHLYSVKSSIGEVKIAQGKFVEAEQLLTSLLNDKVNKGLKIEGYDYLNLGLAHLKTKKLLLAKDNFLKAIRIYEDEKNEAKLGKTYNYLTQLSFEEEDFNKAEDYALKALVLNKENDRALELSETYNMLSNIYHQQNNFEQAMEAKINYDELSKNINRPEELYAISRKIVQQKLKRSNSKGQREEKTLKKGKVLKDEESSSAILGVIIVGSVVALFLAFYFSYVKRKRKALKKKTNGNGFHFKEEDVLRLKEMLQQVMISEKPHLNKELSLNELATLIGTSDKKMSMLLNQHLEISFYDYINTFRVEEFIDQVKKEDNQNYSIEGIALNSGFKSKSSFYRIFKKQMKMSPAEYKKSL